MDDVLIKSSYNKFTQYPIFSYNCISYLINDENSETLWKLLYYDDANAWKSDADHPDLTEAQKRSLVYGGENNPNDYRVFLDMGMDSAITGEICLLRVSPLEIIPSQQSIGYVTMSFEVFCHSNINTLSNYQNRIDAATQYIISALNGQYIDGVGRLYFNINASRQCRSVLVGQLPYRGRRTIMSNWSN